MKIWKFKKRTKFKTLSIWLSTLWSSFKVSKCNCHQETSLSSLENRMTSKSISAMVQRGLWAYSLKLTKSLTTNLTWTQLSSVEWSFGIEASKSRAQTFWQEIVATLFSYFRFIKSQTTKFGTSAASLSLKWFLTRTLWNNKCKARPRKKISKNKTRFASWRV